MRLEQKSSIDKSIGEISTMSNVHKERVQELQDGKRKLLLKLGTGPDDETESLSPKSKSTESDIIRVEKQTNFLDSGKPSVGFCN